MTHLHVTWLIYTWHDSFTRDMTHLHVTWLIYTWHDSFTRDMTHSHVTWLIHTWHDLFTRDMTHLHVTWLIYTMWLSVMLWGMIRVNKSFHVVDSMRIYTCSSTVICLILTWHDSFTHNMTDILTNDKWVTIRVREMTYVRDSFVICQWNDLCTLILTNESRYV